jgi:alpha-L-arabinofuranosidase
VYDQDPDAVNIATALDRVVPSRQDGLKVADGRMEVVLPPLPWNLLRLLPSDDEVRSPG